MEFLSSTGGRIYIYDISNSLQQKGDTAVDTPVLKMRRNYPEDSLEPGAGNARIASVFTLYPECVFWVTHDPVSLRF